MERKRPGLVADVFSIFRSGEQRRTFGEAWRTENDALSIPGGGDVDAGRFVLSWT